jgi:hypothetical protein
MRIKGSRKYAIVAGTVASVLIGGGIAAAYWTTGGSGTGSATAGTSVPVTVAQLGSTSNLYPGGPSAPVNFSINNTNSGPAYVANVVVGIASVVKNAGAPVGTCDATDFTIVQPTAINANVPSGTTNYATSGATIAMVNKAAANQDACKLATVNLSFTVN